MSGPYSPVTRPRLAARVERPVCAERAPPSVVVRGADFALSRSLRGMRLTLQAAVATKSAVDAELEAIQAFGTRQYATRAVQVTVRSDPRSTRV